MTAAIVDQFLAKMLGPQWPREYSRHQREILMRDTTKEEIARWDPKLLRVFDDTTGNS